MDWRSTTETGCTSAETGRPTAAPTPGAPCVPAAGGVRPAGSRPGAARSRGEPVALVGSAAMRVAVLSDIHSNIVALDAVLAAAGAVDAIWELGDIVGYGPEPDAVIARLREVGAVGVRGNHDAAACGGSEIEWFNPD